MPTEINQIDDEAREVTTLRISGEMGLADAVLVERMVDAIHSGSGFRVRLDLADLDFLDSEAASILRRLAERPDVRIEGVEIFLQSIVDQAEGRG